MKQIYIKLFTVLLLTGITQMNFAQCSGKSFTATVNGTGVILNATPAFGLSNQYIWTYGDGQQDTIAIVGVNNYTYSTSGTFNVCLHFTSGSCDTIMCQNVTIVAPCSTTSSFTYDDTQAITAFTATPAFDLNSDFIWNYGDGIQDTTPTIGNTQHAYNVTGTYNVCLKVEDIVNNCSKSVCQNVTITNALGIKNNDASLSSLSVYPNPFNNTTTFNYTLNKESNVEIVLCDILGNAVDVIKNEKETSGQHSINYNTSGVAQGFYILKIVTNNGLTSKMLIKQ